MPREAQELPAWFSVHPRMARRRASERTRATSFARAGTRRSVFAVADSSIVDWTPLGNAGWAWITAGGRSFRFQRLGESAPVDLPLPEGIERVWQVNGSPDGSRIAAVGWTPAFDSILVDMITLADRRATRWAAFFGEGGGVTQLLDGSLLVWIEETLQTNTLYRVRAPGRVERLGTIPRAADLVSPSLDARRVAVRTRNFHGDVWLAHLAPAH